jgi:hypothetical protein
MISFQSGKISLEDQQVILNFVAIYQIVNKNKHFITLIENLGKKILNGDFNDCELKNYAKLDKKVTNGITS